MSVEDSVADVSIGDAGADTLIADLGNDLQLSDFAVDLGEEDQAQPVDSFEDQEDLADTSMPDSTNDVFAQQGDPCRSNNDCNDEWNHLVCITPGSSQCNCTGGSPCGKDGDCDPNMVCDVLRPVWPCVRCYSGGMTCMAACTIDAECPINHKCIDGRCLKKDCVTDADCPFGFRLPVRREILPTQLVRIGRRMQGRSVCPQLLLPHHRLLFGRSLIICECTRSPGLSALAPAQSV